MNNSGFESQYSLHKTKTEHTNVYSILVARRKGFFLGTTVPITSLRSLPRQRKHSTGLFSSANRRFAPSLFESLPFEHKNKDETTTRVISSLLRKSDQK